VTLRLASAPPGADERRLGEAARALESMLLKQIVSSSGAFKGGESPGSAIRADLFASTLADAVAGSGGIGLADQVVRSLTPASAQAPRDLRQAAALHLATRPAATLAEAHALGAAPSAPAPLAHLPEAHLPVEHLPELRLAENPYLDASGEAASGAADIALAGLELPVAGRVTSRFGARRDPWTGARSTHPGVDVGAPAGTPIRAPAGGTVLSAGPRGGYGNAVEIDHGDGLVTLYGHAADLFVSAGDFVEPGQAIATVGSTGRSTGPHLHFEVRQGGRPIDPGQVLKKYGLRAEGSIGSGP